MIFKRINIIWILLLLLTVSSCTGIKTSQLQKHLNNSNCNQQNGISYSLNSIPKPIHELDLDTALTTRFTFASLNAANAIGILNQLGDYVNSLEKYHQEQTIENRLNMLALYQRIAQRINLSSLEISSVASELDCEEERINQIANYMKSREDETETKLTVTAIIAGASGAIISGLLLSNGNAGDNVEYVGIVSGITEATLGLLILTNKRKIEFHHPRNALKEIWEGHDTTFIFPPAVWYYLNYFNPATPGAKSLRYQIIERWMSFKQIDDAKSKKKRELISLYFGEGGKYTTEQLYNRANMYDQLESYIKLIKQDLMSLSIELENIQ